MFERYAIFYTPPAGPFADFGASWLGRDAALGRMVAHPQVDGIDLARLTATPRKYGFHGTLKAPFRLGNAVSEDDLSHAAAGFAATHAPVTPGPLVAGWNRFVALRPDGDTAALNALAGDVVRDFDRFRAPLDDADIQRRRRARLTPRQDRQMLEWGYPYVFDDFHFHMTLSGTVDAAQGRAILQALAPLVEPVMPTPFVLDAITLMGQDTQGMFHQIHRYALTG